MNTIPKKRIAIDMDEVMADTLKARLIRYEKDYGVSVSKQEVHGKSMYQAIPEAHRQQVRDVLDELDFFRHLEVMPDAQKVIKELNEHYDIIVATAAMEVPFSFTAKYDWLLEHFPFLDSQKFVFCGNKSVVLADYLIDDNPHQLSHFTGESIMFSSPTNALENGFKRVNNWQEVAELFLT